MGAAGTKTDETDPTKLEQATQMVGQFLATVLSDEDYADKEELITRQILSHLQEEPVGNKSTLVLKRGEPARGIFFVEKGELHILSGSLDIDGHPVVLAELGKGDFFGEISTLYEKPCTATVEALACTSLYLLPDQTANHIFSSLELRALADVVLDRNYVINTRVVAQFSELRELQTRSCVKILQKVPLFRHWTKDLLVRLLQLQPDPPLLLYPKGSTLACEGDPGGELLILVRGKVDVFYNKEQLTEFHARKLPFVYGEEGLFNPKWRHLLTLRAGSACQLLVVNKDMQEQMENSVWHFADEVKQTWHRRLKIWRDIVKRRHRKTYKTHAAKLQFEVLYVYFRGLSEFQLCTPSCIYDIAQHADGRKCRAGDVILDRNECDSGDMAFMVEGEAVLSPEEAASTNTPIVSNQFLLYWQTGMPEKSEFKAKSTCIVAKLTSRDIAYVLGEHAGCQLQLNTQLST